MKALDILKHKWISGNVVFDKRYNENIRYLKYSEELINKAIKELEELENRSCDNCKYRIPYDYSNKEHIDKCALREQLHFNGSCNGLRCDKWSL